MGGHRRSLPSAPGSAGRSNRPPQDVQLRFAFEPPLVGLHHPPGVRACEPRHEVTPPDIATMSGNQVRPQQGQRQGVPVKLLRGLAQFLRRAPDAEARKIPGAVLQSQVLQADGFHGLLGEVAQVAHRQARGHDAQAGVVPRQLPQQAFQRRVLQAAAQRRPGRVLQRLEAVQHQQRALRANQCGQPLALLPGRAVRRIRVAEPAQRGIDEGIGRGLPALTGALAVEGPAQDAFRAPPVFRLQTIQPDVHQRSLGDAAKSHQHHDADARVIPGGIERRKLARPAEQVGTGEGKLDRGRDHRALGTMLPETARGQRVHESAYVQHSSPSRLGTRKSTSSPCRSQK